MRFRMPACSTALVLLLGIVPQLRAQISPASGKAMCSALTPADFSKHGVPVSALKEANLDGQEGAYCVYSSKAGKVEFDIFFPAGANAKEILQTEKTVLGEGRARFERVQIPGADNAQISMSLPDLPGSACIVVRKGKAVFTIVIPRTSTSRQQLMSLGRVALGRLRQ